MKNRIIKIGHPCYAAWSNNQYAQHGTYTAALCDLLSRGISMRDAHAAIQAALSGAYKTVSNRRRNPIEIQAS